MAVSTQALVSVAMLKVTLDGVGKDHIDQLNLFVKAALPLAGAVIDVSKLKGDILEQYGLRVPREVVERALRRLAKQGVIRKENYAYFAKNVERDQQFSEKRKQASAEIGLVTSAYREFHEENFGNKISEVAAQDSIISFVSKNSIECLRSYVYRTALPKIQHDTEQSYTVARFVNEAHESNEELFRLILVLFSGVMLANAFTCPELDATAKNFKGLTFYFDTSLVLSLVGLHGEGEKLRLQELVGLLENLKSKVSVFGHTIDEVDGVLAWCESALNRGSVLSSSRVISALIQEGKGLSDVIMMRGTVKEKLSDIGINIADSPPYLEELQIDEKALQGILVEGVGYPREKAVNYDINSVRSIYALRAGAVPRRIEDARAVFITSNGSFARAAFAYSRRYEVTKEVSPVITDYSIANVAWLKSPMQAVDLPKHELLGMCFAALAPSDAVWTKFLGAAEALKKTGRITSDDLAILRSDGAAKRDAMDLTIGSDEDFNGEDVTQVLDRAKRRLVAERDKDLENKDLEIEAYKSELDIAAKERAGILSDLNARSSAMRFKAGIEARRLMLGLWASLSVASFMATWISTAPWNWIFISATAITALGPPLVNLFADDVFRSISQIWIEWRWGRWSRSAVPEAYKAEVK